MFVSTIGILARPTSVPTYTMCNRSNWTWNDVTNPTTGKTWMDRNLGANRVATSLTDNQSYGMLYQWGRLSDGHQCVNRYVGDGVTTSGTTTTLSSTDTPSDSLFILNPNYPYDWRNPQNVNLWQGISGVNNPCPTGYRLPTKVESDAELSTWSTLNATGGFGSTLKLSLNGRRNQFNGNVLDVGSGGLGDFWTSTISGQYSYYLVMFEGASSPSNAATDETLFDSYFVYATPTMIIVDEENKLFLKPNSIEHLKAYLEQLN